MNHRLVFEFPSENLRRAFLGMFQEQRHTMGEQLNAGCDFSRTFKTYGWDGKGEPVVRVFRRRKLR